MSVIRSVIGGCGAYLPAKCVTNQDLAKIVDTTDEWITSRTGIKQRYFAADGEVTSDLALRAASQALKNADTRPDEVDLIVLATATPDQTFPASATVVQAGLGITQGAAFDIQAVCTGFIYALSVADNFIKAGQSKTALVIGAETFSRILDMQDRTTCVLFGDGAGAVVLQAGQGEGSNEDRGILASYLRSDGRYKDFLYVDGGPSTTQTAGYLRMQGREVFRYAITNIAESISSVLSSVDMAIEEVDWFVPHQANIRILEGTARKLSIPEEKIILTVADHGNTSAASVPLALNVGISDGRIKKGHVVLFEAMGGGFTWGSVLARM